MEIPADYQRICKMLYYLWMCESGPSSERKGEVGCNSRALQCSGCSSLQPSSGLGWGQGGGCLLPTHWPSTVYSLSWEAPRKGPLTPVHTTD